MKDHKPGQRPGWQPGGSISPTPGGAGPGPRGPCGPRRTGPSCAPSIRLFSLPSSWPSSEVSQLHPRPQLLARSEWWAKLPRSSYQAASPFGPLGPLHLLIVIEIKNSACFPLQPRRGPSGLLLPWGQGQTFWVPLSQEPRPSLDLSSPPPSPPPPPNPSLRSTELN